MTWFVHRNNDGAVGSAHRKRQVGYAEEILEDNDPEIIELIYRPREAAEQQKEAAKAELRSRGTGAVLREEFESFKEAIAALLDE